MSCGLSASARAVGRAPDASCRPSERADARGVCRGVAIAGRRYVIHERGTGAPMPELFGDRGELLERRRVDRARACSNTCSAASNWPACASARPYSALVSLVALAPCCALDASSAFSAADRPSGELEPDTRGRRPATGPAWVERRRQGRHGEARAAGAACASRLRSGALHGCCQRGQRLQLFYLLGDPPVGSKHVSQFLARRQQRGRTFDRLFEGCHSLVRLPLVAQAQGGKVVRVGQLLVEGDGPPGFRERSLDRAVAIAGERQLVANRRRSVIELQPFFLGLRRTPEPLLRVQHVG